MAGFLFKRMRLLVACTNNFDFYATVFSAVSGSFVTGNRLLFAFAFSVDAVSFDTFGHQVCFNRFCATDRQFLVVSIGANGVGVTDSDDDFQVDALEFGYQIIDLGFAVCFQNSLVEIEQCISSKCDFF